ncbi:hypothetical protein FE257_008160 [Aspergillus nanangensis]|uniref:Condensation domain-containing protein n=1 Tax=Aspergillus nanangensis TaxID=2582783 RepID=A0AAD4CM09_ASPNN|nr:hypothetical protein FE257_008160 [Aspergillus nanangensis]
MTVMKLPDDRTWRNTGFLGGIWLDKMPETMAMTESVLSEQKPEWNRVLRTDTVADRNLLEVKLEALALEEPLLGSSQDFLAHVQAQHVRTIPFDYLDLQDIVEKCTSWPADTQCSPRMLHLDDDIVRDLPLDGAILQSSWAEEVFQGTPNVWVHSRVQGDNLKLFLSTSHVEILEIGPSILQRWCDFVEILTQNLETPLSALLR